MPSGPQFMNSLIPSLRRIPRIIKFAAVRFYNHDCTYMAAAISYHVLFSVFPLLIFLLSLFGLFIKDPSLKEEVLRAFIDMVPSSRTDATVVESAILQVAEVSNGALSFVSLIAMAWTASNMFGAIRSSINVAFSVEVLRPYVRQKLLDFAMIFALGMFFLLSIASTATVESLRLLVASQPQLTGHAFVNRAAGEAGFLWALAGDVLPLVLSMAAFLVAYRVLPAKKSPMLIILPAGFIAAILFEACKAGFVFYLENFARYDVIFGSLAGLAGFMGWVYLSSLVLLFGAEIAAATESLKPVPRSTP
jgi:membrane protein